MAMWAHSPGRSGRVCRHSQPRTSAVLRELTADTALRGSGTLDRDPPTAVARAADAGFADSSPRAEWRRRRRGLTRLADPAWYQAHRRTDRHAHNLRKTERTWAEIASTPVTWRDVMAGQSFKTAKIVTTVQRASAAVPKPDETMTRRRCSKHGFPQRKLILGSRSRPADELGGSKPRTPVAALSRRPYPRKLTEGGQPTSELRPDIPVPSPYVPQVMKPISV